MNAIRSVALMAVLAFYLMGCSRPMPPVSPAASSDPGMPIAPNPRLQSIKLWLGAEVLETELALSELQVRTGMMFRTNMPENTAMLFVFSNPYQASFWMAQTTLPLSAAYIDPNGVILEIHDLVPLSTNAVTAGSDRVQYVLETPQGWFQRHHVAEGAVVRSERGSLHGTFFPRR